MNPKVKYLIEALIEGASVKYSSDRPRRELLPIGTGTVAHAAIRDLPT